MQVLGFEFAFIFGRQCPFDFAGSTVQCSKAAGGRDKIQHSTCNGRRGCDRHARLVLPFLFAGFLINRVKIRIRAGNVNHSIRDGGGSHNRAPGFECPLHPPELRWPGGIINTRASKVAVEGGLRN